MATHPKKLKAYKKAPDVPEFMFFERFSPFLLTFAFQEVETFTPPLTSEAIQPTITNLCYDQPFVFGRIFKYKPYTWSVAKIIYVGANLRLV